MAIKNNKISFVKKLEFAIMIIFTIVIIGSVLINIIDYNLTNIFKSIGTLFLVYVPILIAKKYKINLIPEFNIILQLFIFTGVFLGSVCRFYYLIWWLDGTLHGLRGVLLGFVGFILLFMMIKDEVKLNLSISFIVIFMFSFSASISVLWEIFEFTMDSLFNTSMQVFGLKDTMWDIIADSIGSISSSIVVYLYMKKGKETYIIKLINKFLVNNNREAVKSKVYNL